MFAVDKGTIVLVGLTSYGDGCANKKKPGVYTRVASYSIKSFIEENI
jgi:secreted trypsin-like serine protease